MGKKAKWIGICIAIAILAGVALWSLPQAPPNPVEIGAVAAGGGNKPFSYDDYAAALKAYVDDGGMVNYEEMKLHSETLDAFLSAVQGLDSGAYAEWGEKDKIAFWINAYNALTLKAIIANYPIKASWKKSLTYPKNSIRQIPGVWDKLQFTVMGRKMTLDAIEHETLRKQFNEPRIHVALVCAAMGCPPLRNEPFTGDKLDAQFGDQTRRFLRNPEKFRIDHDKDQVNLSPIFKWFGKDFVKTYGTSEGFSAVRNDSERAVLNVIGKHVDEKNREYLETGRYSIKYSDYDWSLNEQRPSSKED